jgi:TatD DNase family protein
MVETDAPFLAPVPHRGKTNQPAYVANTLEFLAEHRAKNLGENPAHVKAAIYENSRRFIQTKERNRNA